MRPLDDSTCIRDIHTSFPTIEHGKKSAKRKSYENRELENYKNRIFFIIFDNFPFLKIGKLDGRYIDGKNNVDIYNLKLYYLYQ